MSQNVGILVSAAIRPNDSLDPIATAYASELMGGLHSAANTSDRNAIIFERREWGMLCYVKDIDKTFQLKYGYLTTNIMDNGNWVEFSGSGGGGGSEWINSVLEVRYSQPVSPTNGQRYLVGLKPGDTITGANWATYSPGYVAEWNSSVPKWDWTVPTDGTSVRVDNEDNAIYKYQGIFPTGAWQKEKSGQVRDINLTTANGLSYSATTTPPIDGYTKDLIFLASFSSQNTGNTMSVNINSLGTVNVRKPTAAGLVALSPADVIPNVVYSLVYDGTQFQLYSPYVNADLFNIKYYIEPTDYIMIPPNYQYWVYSDLTIDGTLVNYGQVILANGNIILGASGSFQNYGQVAFVNFNGGLTSSFNDTNTIQFTQSNTIYGLSVSATVKDSSLTASKLDTGLNGGPTAGYFLSVDSAGDFAWSEVNTSPTNGLSTYGNSIGLGGTLSQNTQISGDNYDLTISNISNLTFTASSFSMSMYNGLVTTDNAEGLVYSADYSATFVTYSLVTKGYVDAQFSSAGTITQVYGSSGLTGGGTGGNLTLTIDPNLAGQGLTFGSGVMDIVFGGTSSGLTFSNDALGVVVDGTTIQINNSGELTLVGGVSTPIYQEDIPSVTSGNDSASGIFLTSTPNSYSTIEVFVNGQKQRLGDNDATKDCYFGVTSSVPISFASLNTGDQLYWNGVIAGFELSTTDIVEIVYGS